MFASPVAIFLVKSVAFVPESIVFYVCNRWIVVVLFVEFLYFSRKGKNNCAILFNSDPTIGKLLPRKFEIFKAVVNTMAQSPEIPGTEYEKILNVSAWTIPNYHLMNYNAVLLNHKSIGAANATHSYCYLFCETYQEYYTIMPSLPLCNMLNAVVTSPVNEPALRKGPLQCSLNTVINSVYATNSSDVSDAYLKVARNKEFRRIY